MLKCKNISCIRGNRELFSNLEFEVELGSIALIVGPNGSGKTTLIRTIAGLSPAACGSISYNGNDVDEDRSLYLSSMIYIGHKNAFKDDLTVMQNIRFWAKMRKTTELIMAAVHYLELQPVLDIRYSELSEGWKRRASLSRLLIANANLWLIDEPFANLDDNAAYLISELILVRAKQNSIVMITGHNKETPFPDLKIINICDFQTKEEKT
ncbi:MAG: cytochrome c biogenesis ATP-binding export protein CcmA [Candidatus Mesenet longicola]|uniref:Cytochrome c biogenesis ATP-binding export protein CcmA n=1 Tax=Candidatus Mesenet longicola TaxID=1892558 RepID=A0A8J3HW97_9RICK|nr:MAG: cytochrome c biogenesis ATP-binding export protein CcmA [Candidatus Mesenet longicola]GHM59441.1 MAG: cytochrome c biogenesis ATP-binding export protein CcmA [Candidatus Mesenet longicola]